MRFILFTIFFLLTTQFITGRAIKGVIKDVETGEELIGATLIWKEYPAKGTVTGLDGSFAIESIENANTLICRYIGYETTEIPVTDENLLLTISLQPAVRQISEIVIYSSATNDSENGARNIEKLASSVMNVVSAKAIGQCSFKSFRRIFLRQSFA